MNRAQIVLVVVVSALSALALEGCSTSCTADMRAHRIDVTRDVATIEPANTLLVEACIRDRCFAATPDASGAISFETPLGEGPIDGQLVSIDPRTTRVQVRYTVFEGGTCCATTLKLRVKRKSGNASLLDASADVRWADGVGEDEGCHPTPLLTSL